MDDGVATGLGIDGLLNPVTGSQLYVTLSGDDAKSCPEPPVQISVSADVVTNGSGFTVTFTVSMAVHWLPGFTVMMYCTLAFGFAEGINEVGLDKPVAGDQL